MARIHTHYDNLKVARNAPPEVIRAAYKTLSQKYHPDRNPNSPDAMRIIKIINSAYEVLSDPVKRHEHDEWIARSEAENKGGSAYANLNFCDVQGPAKSPTRMRQRTYGRSHGSRRKRGSPGARLVEKIRNVFGQFSRYILRKG